MPKGGARINSGPPPDPNALRRDRPNDRDGWTSLPSEGWKGTVPKWPLPSPTDLETEMWKQIWRTPQAVAWQQLRWTREVALYVRWQVVAELGSLDAGKEARQWSDRLGLNPAAMLRNRWRVVQDEVLNRKKTNGARQVDASMRDRLRAVDGGA